MKQKTTNLWDKINQSTRYIKKQVKLIPEIAIVLGTGLGRLAREIKRPTGSPGGRSAVIPYTKIPHFPVSTVLSHKGELILGTLQGHRVVAMQGRFHYYEGYSLEQITLPIRVMRSLGAKILILSSAVGALRAKYQPSDLVLVEDQINLMGVNPLIGVSDDRLGPRFPDMSEPYNRGLLAQAEKIARALGIRFHRGVYAAMTGPNLETRAEYRFLRIIGADVIGMSTIPEVIVGVQCGFKILGIAVVTDLCIPETLKPANIQEIINTANRAEPKMTALVKELIKTI